MLQGVVILVPVASLIAKQLMFVPRSSQDPFSCSRVKQKLLEEREGSFASLTCSEIDTPHHKAEVGILFSFRVDL
jgi:hypothetical protein